MKLNKKEILAGVILYLFIFSALIALALCFFPLDKVLSKLLGG